MVIFVINCENGHYKCPKRGSLLSSQRGHYSWFCISYLLIPPGMTVGLHIWRSLFPSSTQFPTSPEACLILLTCSDSVIPAWLDVFYSSFTQLLCNVTCWVELRALYRTTVINSGNSDADIESLGQSLPDMASASPRCAWGDAWLKHHSPCRRLDTECRHGRPLGSWELDFEALEAALA